MDQSSLSYFRRTPLPGMSPPRTASRSELTEEKGQVVLIQARFRARQGRLPLSLSERIFRICTRMGGCPQRALLLVPGPQVVIRQGSSLRLPIWECDPPGGSALRMRVPRTPPGTFTGPLATTRAKSSRPRASLARDPALVKTTFSFCDFNYLSTSQKK